MINGDCENIAVTPILIFVFTTGKNKPAAKVNPRIAFSSA
jgi:hypothetical protein